MRPDGTPEATEMAPAVIPTDFRRSCAVLLLALAAVLAVFPTWADEADDSFAVAMGHYAVKRWRLAAEEFQAFLERYPNHPKADRCTFLLAEAMLQLGNHEQASRGFRQYLEREPDGEFARPALFRAGEAAYMAGKFDSAKRLLMRFHSQYPSDKLNAFVLTYLGDIAMAEEAPAAAAGHFRRCLEQFPDGRLQDDCRFGLARALEKQNQNQQAEQLYQAVAAKPQNPLADDAQFHLAVLQYTMGKHAEAVETFSAFETSLVKSPWRAKARLGRGWALMKLDRLDEAETIFRSIVNVAQVALDGRYWLGMVQREQENWAAAAKTLMDTAEAAKAADPGDSRIPVLHFYAGDALRRAGELKTAGEQFDLVLECEAAGNDWTDDALLGKTLAALEADDHKGVDQAAAEFNKRCPYSPLRADLRRALARSWWPSSASTSKATSKALSIATCWPGRTRG